MKAMIFIHRISLLLGLLIFFTGLQAQNDNDYYTVNGTIKNMRNKKKIPYVNVYVPGTNVGTISNEDGEFILKLDNSLKTTGIELSAVGFYNTRIEVSKDDQPDQTFYMNPLSVKLSEVEVLGWENPRELIATALEKVETNYSLIPNLMTGFYRETAQKGKKYINISEAIIHLYKDSYKADVFKERVQVLKGRNLISPKFSDTLAVKLLGGPNLAIFCDIVKNPGIILDKNLLYYYSYKIGDMTSINNRIQYVVHFSPQVLIDQPLYSGTFYIDRETLAFTRAEFKMDMHDKDKVTALILKHKPKGLRFSPQEVGYVISYRQNEGKTYLNYVHNEMKFKCDWKRRLFATNYTVISEMVVTDNQIDNITRIPVKSSFSMNKSLSEEAMTYYDSDFWGAYNIIEPTESLEMAVGKLKKVQ
ncbi:MAG: carboxypeptidase-like regulatory domain-containing protein [Dysgonamonadaceae bacterium]|jgi:hypothetical protein|nr:carboxypeptidase-like regulatory domain-containing protein [Dysgonamonadaceae bacterium]